MRIIILNEPDLREACFRRLPIYKRVPRSVMGLPQLLKEVALDFWLNGSEGWEPTAFNVRLQLFNLRRDGQTSFERAGQEITIRGLPHFWPEQ